MSRKLDLTATVAATYALHMLNLMVEWGHEERAVLDGCQVDRVALQNPRTVLELWQYAKMLSNSSRLDTDGGLAYEFGLRSQINKHGYVGFGLISCASLREAIVFAERYFQTRVSMFQGTVRITESDVVIELKETIPLGSLRPFVMDFAVVALCTVFAKILDVDPMTSGWQSAISVPYAEPAAYARYKHRLPPFRFNHGTAVQIHLPAKMLDEPIATADSVSMQLATERCEQALSSQGMAPSVSAQVISKLVCRDGRYPDFAAMALMLQMSERTLKRRLQEDGSSFQALLDQVKQQDSMRLLSNPSLAIQQVAQAVGYSDPANFARAFSKWTGTSPREWRGKLRPLGLN